jgi:tetratricopeptide (TPR) repeat protein
MIEQIDRKQSKYLGNTAKCLLGQVYNDLFGDANTAYEYFLQGCDKSESLYNAYIFKIKGMYWQYFVGDYQRAIKYFYKSVCIHKEYFAAWYKMGFCYYKMDKKRKAFIAFNAVVKILKPKFMQTCLTPKETEHLFLASKQCAGIIYELDADIERAIEYDLLAESVWKNIGDNGFYMFLSDDYEEQNNLRKETQRRLNIKMVYDHISKMYKMDNEYQIARKYEEKYLSVENT